MGAVLTELFKRYAEGKDFGQEAFMVGGTVRDMILGRPVKDADIAVKGDIFEIGRSFADFSDGSFILLDKDFGIVRVAKNNEYVDLCKMRGPSIQDDLADRDLTINAMAIPVLKLESLKPEAERESSNKIIIDPFNGLNDLKYGIIRMVSEDNLISDPLRILRVYRFSATLSFQIEVHTSTAVRTHAALIRDAAVERIAEELRHILMVDDSYSAIKQMEKDGLLLHVFPELREFSIEVWNHCRQSYGYVEHILRNLPLYFQDRSKSLWDYFAEEYRQVCIKLSVLFQDAEIAEKMSCRLRLSRKEVGFIRMISARRDSIKTLTVGDKPAVTNLLRNNGDDIYALLIYALATTRICQLSGDPLLTVARNIVALYQDEFIPRRNNLPLINGNDLIEEFGLSPSPAFREILSAIELLVLEGKVTSRDEALRAAAEIMREKKLGTE